MFSCLRMVCVTSSFYNPRLACGHLVVDSIRMGFASLLDWSGRWARGWGEGLSHYDRRCSDGLAAFLERGRGSCLRMVGSVKLIYDSEWFAATRWFAITGLFAASCGLLPRGGGEGVVCCHGVFAATRRFVATGWFEGSENSLPLPGADFSCHMIRIM
jgi:hypothetical protein